MSNKTNNKMTRQGVRDLNSIKSPPRKKAEIPPDCDHSKMRVHYNKDGKPSGHLVCECGLEIDEGEFYTP